VGTELDTLSVAAERDDPRSMLHLYRRLLEERRSRPALSSGSWADVASPNGTIAYLRRSPDGRGVVAVAANLVGTAAEVDLAPAGAPAWRVIVSTGLDREGELITGSVTLRGDEALVLEPADG
jgi:alpha-glucosidase